MSNSAASKTLKKGSAFGPVANLLSQFQIRLDSFTGDLLSIKRELQNSRSHYSQTITKANEFIGKVADVHEKVIDANRMAQDALLDVDKQKGTNKELTESLYKLRDSVQKSFDSVRADMVKLIESQQRLNERISKVESGLASISTFANSAHQRLDKLEQINIDSRDYEKINSLEQRVSVVEGVIKAVRVLIGLVNKV